MFALVFWAYVQIFMFCELGENITDRFDRILTIIYDSEWYTFPTQVQRALPTVMIAAQQQIVLQGLGNVKYRRESLKEVKRVNDFIKHLSKLD